MTSDLTFFTNEPDEALLDRFKATVRGQIIIAEDALQISATVDLSESTPQGGIYFGVLTSSDYLLMAILALLNSKLLSFMYEILFGGMHMGGGYLRYRTSFLEGLPISQLSKDLPSSLASKGQEIISCEETSSVLSIEKEIDRLGYQRYRLTAEEIAIVEGRK